MASISNSLTLKHGLSHFCSHSASLHQSYRTGFQSLSRRRTFVSASSSFANENREFVSLSNFHLHVQYKHRLRSSGISLFGCECFEILSLSGSYMPTDNGETKSRTGGMSVTLAGLDGRVVGGGLTEFLVAADPMQVVMGSFLPGRDGQFSTRYVIVGGGNAAGYAAKTFVENGMADGRLCIVSKEIFGGVVNAGNSKLRETDLYEDDYLLFNFNDYPNGMVTLFNLVVLGNWQVWMQSYKDFTNSWALIYFISFFLISILLLLNSVIAFVLEAFFAEMDVEAEKKPEEENKNG